MFSVSSNPTHLFISLVFCKILQADVAQDVKDGCPLTRWLVVQSPVSFCLPSEVSLGRILTQMTSDCCANSGDWKVLCIEWLYECVCVWMVNVIWTVKLIRLKKTIYKYSQKVIYSTVSAFYPKVQVWSVINKVEKRTILAGFHFCFRALLLCKLSLPHDLLGHLNVNENKGLSQTQVYGYYNPEPIAGFIFCLCVR